MVKVAGNWGLPVLDSNFKWCNVCCLSHCKDRGVHAAYMAMT